MIKKTRPAIRRLWVFEFCLAVLILTFPFWIGIFYPKPHTEWVEIYSRQYQLDPLLVYALMRQESRYQPGVESQAGAQGLMQILPDTAAWLAEKEGMAADEVKEERLKEPETNIRLGCIYLAWLNHEFQGNLPVVLAAYNAGPGKVRQWLEEETWNGEYDALYAIPFEETRGYVRGVLRNYRTYQLLDRLHGMWQAKGETVWK